MEFTAGEIAAKRKHHSSYTAAEEDRISALPDDILVLILVRLDDDAAAGRASALSRRWRGLWTLLPELCFPADADPQSILTALSAHEADLRCLRVGTQGATPESVAAWIHAAAARVPGSLIFRNRAPGAIAGEGYGEGEKGTFELPTSHRATAFSLDLGFLGLAMPPASVFAGLTNLALKRVRFGDPYDLGDIVSSPRCPRLEKLVVDDAHGLLYLDIRSESLIDVTLLDLHGLALLNVAAPALRHLTVHGCFVRHRSRAEISAPQLEWLAWLDLFDPLYVQLGATAKLQMLIVRLLDYSGVLSMVLKYPHNIGNLQSLMGKLTVLPDLMVLNLMLINNGHSFGASIFHVLRMCSGLKAVRLDLDRLSLLGMQVHFSCPLGCVCDEPSNWKTKEITLNCLEKVEIHGIRGADHEVKFLEQFFKWATVLETMSITFHYSISEIRARKLCQMLSSFSRPETHIPFTCITM